MNSTIKVVINKMYGGFSLSEEGLLLYEKLSGKSGNISRGRNIPRTDIHLVKVVEILGVKANGKYADLCVKEIPAEFSECYVIDEHDGQESIDISSYLLISHRLKQIDVIEGLSAEQCKEILTELWHINNI